jgi:hypothetical protein
VGRRLLSLAVLGTLVVALAAACGGSSKSAATTTAAATTTTASSGTSGAPTFASTKNCRQLEAMAVSVAKSITPGAGGKIDPKKYADVMNAMANAAPSAIRGDFKTFAEAYSQFVDTLEKSGYQIGSATVPSAAQLAALTTAAKKLSAPKVKQAEQNLSAWGQKNCSFG